MARLRRFALPLALVVGGCSTIVPPGPPNAPPPPVRSVAVAALPVAPSMPPVAKTAMAAGAVPVPFTVEPRAAAAALPVFRSTCPALLRREDRSGLTRAADWQGACDAASRADADPARFFAEQFGAVRVGDGAAFATGYYEPEIAGARTRSDAYPVPIYRRPPDLIEVDLGQFSESLKGRKVSGRVEGTSLIPYHDRGAIDDGALAGRGLELAFAADPVELFFLQVQGSGRLRLPDGGVMRIGYAGQNGRDYVGIGALLRQRGLLAPGQASMQGIMAWLRANPAEGRAVMRENLSYVFFRELTGAGAIGALGVSVTPRVTVAADPAFVPLGAPVLLTMARSEASGLWITQDTGGAIKGANRFDTFWGAGEEARTIAGGMSSKGTALILVPRAAAARLARPDAPPPAP